MCVFKSVLNCAEVAGFDHKTLQRFKIGTYCKNLATCLFFHWKCKHAGPALALQHPGVCSTRDHCCDSAPSAFPASANPHPHSFAPTPFSPCLSPLSSFLLQAATTFPLVPPPPFPTQFLLAIQVPTFSCSSPIPNSLLLHQATAPLPPPHPTPWAGVLLPPPDGSGHLRPCNLALPLWLIQCSVGTSTQSPTDPGCLCRVE